MMSSRMTFLFIQSAKSCEPYVQCRVNAIAVTTTKPNLKSYLCYLVFRLINAQINTPTIKKMCFTVTSTNLRDMRNLYLGEEMPFWLLVIFKGLLLSCTTFCYL